MLVFFGISLVFLVATYLTTDFLHQKYPATWVTVVMTIDIIIGVVIWIFGYFTVKGEEKEKVYMTAVWAGIFLNPFILAITILIIICVNTWECRFKIKEYWEPKIAFVKSGLVWVHSKFRFTAMIWIAVGIVAGYLYGGDQMIMYGTATGLLLGTVDYFLVAVRWLKLKPSL